METVQEFLWSIGIGALNVAKDPAFYLIAIFIAYMYKREAYKLQNDEYLKKISSMAIRDIIRGVAIGIVLSSICRLCAFNIPLDQEAIVLIPIALLLMFLNPKLGCFSYIVPITYLIHSFISKEYFLGKILYLPYNELFAMVGILHILEGILVVLYGHENTVILPIYKNRRIMKAYFMKKFWLVPLIIFYPTGTGIIATPVYSILCYSDISIYKSAKQKKKVIGGLIMVYGLAILLMYRLIEQGTLTLGVGLLIMPFLHESIFVWDAWLDQTLHYKKTADCGCNT